MAHVLRVALIVLAVWCIVSAAVGLALGRLAKQNEWGW